MTEPYPGSPEFFAQTRPDGIAFFEGDLRVTWRDWNARADRLAHALLRMGVKPGDRIAARLAIRHEWFVVHLAISKVGAALIGLNNRSTLEEMDYLLGDSGATGLVIDDPDPGPIIAIAREKGVGVVVSFAAGDRAPGPLYAEIVADDAGPAEPLVSPAPAPLILYTSGTTGRPKGVALDPALLATRQNVQAYREYMARITPTSETSRFLLSMPLHHSAGPNSALFCLRAGGGVVIQRKFDPEQALALIQEHRVTNWMAVPTMVHRLEALPPATRQRYDRSSVAAVNIGAAAVPVSIKRWAKDFFGPQCLIFEGYGMSETQMISYMLPDDWEIAPQSSGKPMPYVDVRIMGPGGETLGPDETGEICVRTPLMIDRYLNRPPLGAEDLTPDGYFRTGDVGRLDGDGYLYVTDRLKDMVIVGGTNVYPAEVEAALHAHPDVLEAAVIGVPDADMGEQVLAICEMKPGAPRDPEGLIAHCRLTLASYKVPKAVAFIDELPRNPTGKVTKTVLRAPYWAGRDRKV